MALPGMPSSGAFPYAECCAAPPAPQNPDPFSDRTGGERARGKTDRSMNFAPQAPALLNKGNRQDELLASGDYPMPDKVVGGARGGVSRAIGRVVDPGNANSDVATVKFDDLDLAYERGELSYRKGEKKLFDGRSVGRINAGMGDDETVGVAYESVNGLNPAEYVGSIARIALQYRALQTAIGVREGDVRVNAAVDGRFAGKIRGVFHGDAQGKFDGQVIASKFNGQVCNDAVVEPSMDDSEVRGVFKGAVEDALFKGRGVGVVDGETLGTIQGTMDGDVDMWRSFKNGRFDGMVAELLACGLSVKDMKAEVSDLGMRLKKAVLSKTPGAISRFSKTLQNRLYMSVAGLFHDIDRKYFGPSEIDKRRKLDAQHRRFNHRLGASDFDESLEFGGEVSPERLIKDYNKMFTTLANLGLARKFSDEEVAQLLGDNEYFATHGRSEGLPEDIKPEDDDGNREVAADAWDEDFDNWTGRLLYKYPQSTSDIENQFVRGEHRDDYELNYLDWYVDRRDEIVIAEAAEEAAVRDGGDVIITDVIDDGAEDETNDFVDTDEGVVTAAADDSNVDSSVGVMPTKEPVYVSPAELRARAENDPDHYSDLIERYKADYVTSSGEALSDEDEDCGYFETNHARVDGDVNLLDGKSSAVKLANVIANRSSVRGAGNVGDLLN